MQDLVPDSLAILGVDVSVLPSDEAAADLIRRRILAGARTFCIAINPEKVYLSKRNPRLGAIVRSAHIRICDGIGISLASMVLHRRRIPRCTGIDLFMKLIRVCARENLRVFILGASPETNQEACWILTKEHPGLQIAGRHHGFFTDSAPIIEEVNRSGADVLFVAMGSPLQEFWLAEQMPRLQVRLCMGVGGSLDVVSGSVKRAPALFRGTGLEWLYRLLSQPSRLRRQAVLPVFAIDVLKSLRLSRYGS